MTDPNHADGAVPPTLNGELLKATVEAWRKTVEVQQHFNDISLRIRNFAITVLGAVLSVAGLIYKDAPTSYLPAVAVLCGLLLCLGFFLMDEFWYHRLLLGSVDTGLKLEEHLRSEYGIPIDLGEQIKAKSHVLPSDLPLILRWPFLRTKDKVKSTNKVRTFWRIVLLSALLFAAVLFFAAVQRRARAAETPTVPTVTCVCPATTVPTERTVADTASDVREVPHRPVPTDSLGREKE